jgi:hypothetical protein
VVDSVSTSVCFRVLYEEENFVFRWSFQEGLYYLEFLSKLVSSYVFSFPFQLLSTDILKFLEVKSLVHLNIALVLL